MEINKESMLQRKYELIGKTRDLKIKLAKENQFSDNGKAILAEIEYNEKEINSIDHDVELYFNEK